MLRWEFIVLMVLDIKYLSQFEAIWCATHEFDRMWGILIGYKTEWYNWRQSYEFIDLKYSV